MINKSLATISRKECRDVYKEILENSDQKWNEGKLLSGTKSYGTATSLAIISIEELIKALIIFFDGIGFEFRRVKGMNRFFKHHQIRYFIAYSMFVLSLIGDEFFVFLSKMRNNPEEAENLIEELENDNELMIKKFKYYGLRKFVILSKEFKWFSQTDIFRQEGFYSDYKDQIKNPMKITETHYFEVIQRLEKVRNVCKELIKTFDSQSEVVEKLCNTLKIDFKKKNYYGFIERNLKTMQEKRKTPFDLIRNQFLDFDR
jgi:AbiV family abortive infection protein